MKKSNKILLGGFLVAVLLLSALHISLWAKYKSGDYVAYQPEDELASMVMQSFPHVKFVSVRHVSSLNVHFSDTARVQESEGYAISYTKGSDTLVISGKDSLRRGESGPITMQLPRNGSLHAFKSVISFSDYKNSNGNNPVLLLNESSVRFNGTMLNVLNISAFNRSSVDLAGTEINGLQLQLQNSTLEDSEGNIGALSITTDSLSRIALQAKHFSKAKTNTPPHE